MRHRQPLPSRSPTDMSPSWCTENEPTRPPLTVKFEIPYFTVSGIQVRYLKIVEKSGYQALPWVRYITQNGDDYRLVRLFESVGSADHMVGFTSLRTAQEKGSTSIVQAM